MFILLHMYAHVYVKYTHIILTHEGEKNYTHIRDTREREHTYQTRDSTCLYCCISTHMYTCITYGYICSGGELEYPT